MKNKNDKRGKSPANFYDRIAGCYGSAKALILAEVARNGVRPITKHLSSNLETD